MIHMNLHSIRLLVLMLIPGVAWLAGLSVSPAFAQESQPEPRTTVKAYVQIRPGGERQEAEMPVYESPVDLPIVAASEANLDDVELVMGVVTDGQAMAWPIRYLAMYEVVNSRAGKRPVAPTW